MLRVRRMACLLLACANSPVRSNSLGAAWNAAAARAELAPPLTRAVMSSSRCRVRGPSTAFIPTTAASSSINTTVSPGILRSYVAGTRTTIGKHNSECRAFNGYKRDNSFGGSNAVWAVGEGQRTAGRGRGGSSSDMVPCFSVGKRQNSHPVSTDELTQEARERAALLATDFVLTPPSVEDLRCIEERQLRHRAGDAVGVSPPCRHGFPQAFTFDPVGHKISSGLFRLSCPLLVQAIDRLEEDGGLEDVNARLEVDEELRQDFMAVNLVHGLLRRRLVPPEKVAAVEQTFGKESFQIFLGSGITGLTPGKVRDAKCLHAHVADALMRGRGANAIGRTTLELLEADGLATSGCGECCQQCDFRVEETANSWRYTPQKNKQRLQQKKVRKRAIKAAAVAQLEITRDDGVIQR